MAHADRSRTIFFHCAYGTLATGEMYWKPALLTRMFKWPVPKCDTVFYSSEIDRWMYIVIGASSSARAATERERSTHRYAERACCLTEP